MATVLSIIAPQDFQAIEYGNSKAALEAAGHTVVTGCSEPMAIDKQGNQQKVDVLLDEANTDDYDAILFVGGPGCAAYFEDSTAHRLARDFHGAGKLTAAICAAPSILANAGLLEGKTCTCFPSQADHLKSKGARVTGKNVEIDGIIVTGNGPPAAKAFGQAIAKLLG
ncbi:MAG: DJ-1/PfpI family protein [Candidatus Peregrinibacteria bacterium]